MHPAMQDFYKWMLWFHDDGVFIADPNWTFNPDEVLILNEHGTVYMPRTKSTALNDRFFNGVKEGKFITLAQRMKQ
jgi:hypothetical protein